MAYQALYRKYRPKTFADVVGQEHITDTLRNELSENKIVHAYLFTGTRGTGKTTCAKILSKAINCLNPKDGNPCGECEMCRAISEETVTDICEIDAASNNGINDIRELREQVNFSPVTAKYRVYIIDEVHMLSISAFNGLLKTLEEPPEHVVFILATTEVHKLPSTILSRCQRFDFRRIDPEKIIERLKYVAECEGLTLTDDAASLIAGAADGGMRDALSILDLCASNNTSIDESVVANVCAMAGNDYLLGLADLIKQKDIEGAIMMLDKLHNSSVDMLRLLNELIGHYRDLMIVKTVKAKHKPIVCSAAKLLALENQAQDYELGEIMAVLNVLQSATAAMQTGNRRCEMEMAIIKLCSPKVATDIESLELRIAALERSTVSVKPTAEPKPEEKEEPKDEVKEAVTKEITEPTFEEEEIPLPEAPDEYAPEPEVQEPEVKEAEPKVTNNEGDVPEWEDIISILRKTCPLIAGVLQGSKAYIKGDYLLIDSKNSQFRSLVNNATYRNSIRNAAEQVLGSVYKLGPYRKAPSESEDPLASFAAKLKELEN
ncbi:MAG: DNA polymerase III subunit gamma/tau [Clostridia bacterium]|nr:DNA polymerase III subunit gamma/tau [Clostridia bacterium]